MKYQIQIPEPCNENWNNMTTTQQGKFCGVCNKEVQDFTKISNFTLAKKLDTNQNICGRFNENQLNVDLNSLSKSNFFKVKSLLTITSLLAITTPVFSQGNVKMGEVIQKDTTYKSILKKNRIIKPKNNITLKGIVTDDFGEIHDINVQLKGNKAIQTVSDFQGEFTLTFTKEDFKTEFPILVFSHVSYNTQELIVENYSNKQNEMLQIKITEEDYFLGEIIIVKQTFGQKLRNLFREKKSCNK